jgi:putative DNA primase/helicase
MVEPDPVVMPVETDPVTTTVESTVTAIAGVYLIDLLNLPASARATDALGSERGRLAADWHRQNIGHGRYPLDPRDGMPTPNPYVHDLLAIPTDLIAPLLAQRGLAVPTRSDYDTWLATTEGDPVDAELELWRVANVADPDLSPAEATEARFCGVPMSVYDALRPHEQERVREGLVIAPPKGPLFVARWLARQQFTARLKVPGTRRRAWMRTLIYVDQTWYRYEAPAPGEPWRWVAHTDDKWMPAQLQDVLGRLWYVHDRVTHPSGGETHDYSLKSWNPDTRTLKGVEDALANLLTLGGGTGVRELADHYGVHHHAYGDGVRIRVRNGVLDPATGTLSAASPLWFSTSVVATDYTHALDPYADTGWLRMLRTQWPDDPAAITCLQQWFGYVLSGRTDLQKWLMIFGPPGSSKSIIATVLAAVVGSFTAASLDTLNAQFGLQSLYESGASLALLSDIRFGARDSSTAVSNLLAVIGEDEVTIERKYKTAVNAKLGVRFHASANEMPRWNDNSNALARRALLLETSRSFRGTEDEDHGLRERIIANELPQVLRWAVEGLALLNAAAGVFTRSGQSDELHADMAELSSPVRTFVNDCCELGTKEDFVDLPALYRVWCKWAEENNTGKGMSQNKFRAALTGLYLDPVRPGQKRMPDGEKGKWAVVWGIKRGECSYTERGQYGIEHRSTISTDERHGSDPLGDRRN